MFNIIINECPGIVEISGHSFKISTDFKVILKILNILEETEDKDRAGKTALRLFYGNNMPDDVETAILAFLEFVSNKSEPEEPKETEASPEEERIFDMLFDSNYIYAAFLQNYGIDLIDTKMHWWKFKTLVEGLPSNTKLSDIIQIRGQELPKDSKQRAQMNRLKEAYKLPGKDKQDEQIAENTINSLFAWAKS